MCSAKHNMDICADFERDGFVLVRDVVDRGLLEANRPFDDG